MFFNTLFGVLYTNNKRCPVYIFYSNMQYQTETNIAFNVST